MALYQYLVDVNNNTTTAKQVLEEIRYMVRQHKINKRPAPSISIDTLAIMFQLPIPKILVLLNQLQTQGAIGINSPELYTSVRSRNRKRMPGTVTLIAEQPQQ